MFGKHYCYYYGNHYGQLIYSYPHLQCFLILLIVPTFVMLFINALNVQQAALPPNSRWKLKGKSGKVFSLIMISITLLLLTLFIIAIPEQETVRERS